jgi:MerR family mercuric resistance operon transcriptional regulator
VDCVVTCAEVKTTVRSHLDSVREKIADLERIERALSAKRQSCSGKEIRACPLIDALFAARRPT